MKILFITIGKEIVASSRTRVYQYIPYIEENNIGCRIISMNEISAKKGGLKIMEFMFKKSIIKIIKYLKIINYTRNFDILFIQKVLPPILIQKIITLFNKKIIFDFDDAIWALHPNDRRLYSKLKNLIKKLRLRHLIKVSKLVITLDNIFIKEYVEKYNKNILLLNTPVNCEVLIPKTNKRSKEIVIGWIGNPENTYYLKPLLGVFKEISRKYSNVVFKLVGSSKIGIVGINFKIKEWSLESEIEDLQSFDIGIMPLTDDEWSKGKGGYKLLQYMAVGIPCVASPIGINSKLVKEGVNGYLARTEEEWFKKLEHLIKHRKIRETMGIEGRKIVNEKYSLISNACRLIKAIKEVNFMDANFEG